MGAHHVVDTHSAEQLQQAAGSFDFILSTVNASLDWTAYLLALAPKGRLHIVGVVPEPLPIPAFPLIAGERSVGGSPSGAPVTEEFPMSRANEALAHLEAGKARYRVVLRNDLA